MRKSPRLEVLLLVTLGLCVGVQAQANTSAFYSFGVSAGDIQLPQEDDRSSDPISLTVPIPFFGSNERTLYVNTNGILSFRVPFTEFTPQGFPLNESSLIAPFWDDVDTRRFGNIYYRLTSNATLLQRARDQLQELFPSTGSFTPTQLVIATWDRVAEYNQNGPQANTFQAVIATDGQKTFALFIYGDIEWGDDATIGFNAGVGNRSIVVTTQPLDVETGSNVGVTGLYINRIDLSSILSPDDVTIGFNQTTYSVREDAGSVTVNVSVINGRISGDTIITLSTVPGGSATAGNDYTPVTADLTFNSTNGATPQTVTIPILSDLLLEGSEVFDVTLTTNNSNIMLLPELATVIIENVEVVIGFNQTTYSVREDTGSVTVSVSVISGTISQDVIITLSTVPGGSATAGNDYTPVTADLTFNSTNGATPQTVTIPILDDLLLEDSEIFNVTLTGNNITFLPDLATVTIQDVEIVIGFNQRTYSVSEDAGSVAVSVSVMNGTISQDVIITLSTAPGDSATAGGDYTPVTADLTFNSTNAAIPQTVTIPILDDLLLEGSEVFNVTLTTNSAVLASDFTTVTIEDIDGITVGFFCPGSYSVAEDAGSVNVTVEILRGTPARDVTVTLQTVDGSARAGLDYDAVTTTLTFDVSMPTQVVTIPIRDDMIVENTESFTVALATNDTAVTLRLQTATVSIRDNDMLTVGFNQTAYTVNEGAGFVNTTVSVLNGTLARNVYVTAFTSDATASSTASTDYTALSRSLVFNGATGSQTVLIPIQDDMVVENQFESFFIRLSTSDSAVMLDPVSANVTVEDNDMVTIGFSGNYSVREDAGSISITVLILMNSLARGVVVTLSTQDDTAQAGMDYNTVSRNLTFNTAVTSQTVVVAIMDDLVVERSEIINLTLTSTDPAVILNPSTSTITIEDVDMVTIGFNRTAYSVSEDAGSVTVTLSVQTGALDRDVIVTLSTINGTALSGEEYTPVSTNVIFSNSTPTQTVDIPILDNVIVADPTVFSVTLTSNDTAVVLGPASANITIEDEDMVTIGFDPVIYTVDESAGSANVTVNVLNGTLDRDMRVRLMTSLTGGTANASEDYTITSTNLTFSTTISSQTVTIPILEDDVVEDSETINVTLTSADPAAILNPTAATVTIQDSNGVTIGFNPTTYTVNEGVDNTSVVVSLLSGSLARDVIVSLQTLSITATAGMDFPDTLTNLTFNSSSRTQTVMVSILNDVVPEDMLEYFSLMLTSTDPAVTLNPATANVTIIDDTDMVTIGFDPVTYSVLEEDASSVNVTVSVLNGTLARNVVVTLSTVSGGTATGGEDYTDVTITLTFGPTVSTQMATVPILDDNVDEDIEFFDLTLTSTDNGAMLNPSTATVSIEDMDLPTITTDPQNVFNVVPGHNVTFSVAAVGVRLTYTWQLENGSALPSDNRFITNNETLSILDVMLTDPDSYRCVVANAVGNVTSNSANFTLIDPPIITVPPQSIATDNGSNAEFSCTARGEGTLTITWTTTAPVEIPSSAQTQFSGDGNATSTLTLTNVGTNHSGEYACSVRNERGSTGPLQATLTIVEISDIADRTVTLGTNATFTCSATGPGDIMYRWNKTVFDRNGVLMEIGFFNESRVSGENMSTLAIIDVGVWDEGSYTCFVSINGTNTGDRTANLSTQGPTILEGPNSTNLLLGSDLTLECIAQNNVDAPDELEFYWYHNGRSITPGSRIMINSTGENDTRVASSELVVMQVTDNDSGEYQCTVTNRDVVDGINATSNVTVYFTQILQFLSGEVVRNATTSLLLECTVEAVPPVPFLEIRRRSQEGDIVLSTILGSSRMLTLQYVLENLMLNDSAVYVCVANNSIGLEEQNFTLVVQAPPGEVNHTTVTRELLTLQSVRLTWAQPEDNSAPINSYNITYCVSINSSCVQQTSMETSSTETVILSQLIPAMTYTVYIRAENNAGQGPEPIEPYIFESTNEVDAQPVSVNAAFVSSTGVVLLWQLPPIAEEASINSFTLSYSLIEDSEGNTTRKRRQSGNVIIRTLPYQQGRILGVVVSGLDSDSTYEFRLSVNYSDPALLSVEATLTVHTNTTDSQPSTTVSLNVQRNFIIVSWPPPGGEDFVVNYILMYTSVSKVDQQTASGNITIPSNQTSYNFTSPFLLPYSDYSFALFADFGDGEVPQIVAPFAAVSLETAPSSPVGLQVQSIFHISLNLSWSAPLQQNGNITQYTVYYQPASSNVERSVVLPDYTPGSLYTLEELSPNTEYNIRVTASTDAGEGEGARIAETTTFGVYPPEIVSVNASTEEDTYLMIIGSFQTTFGPLSHYKIVIVRGSNTTNTRRSIPDNTLLPDSRSQTSYYVAAAIRVEDFQNTFLIGDRQTYTLDNETFVNVPLSTDQEYTVFIRLYSDLNSTIFEDSIPQTFITPIPPVNVGAIAGPVVVVCILLIILIVDVIIAFLVFMANKRRRHIKYKLYKEKKRGRTGKSGSEEIYMQDIVMKNKAVETEGEGGSISEEENEESAL